MPRKEFYPESCNCINEVIELYICTDESVGICDIEKRLHYWTGWWSYYKNIECADELYILKLVLTMADQLPIDIITHVQVLIRGVICINYLETPGLRSVCNRCMVNTSCISIYERDINGRRISPNKYMLSCWEPPTFVSVTKTTICHNCVARNEAKLQGSIRAVRHRKEVK